MKLLHSLLALALTSTLTQVLSARVEQLNGAPGPFFDGINGANRADLAALLVIKEVMPEIEFLTYFFVVNEYLDNKLIRQSSCLAELDYGWGYSSRCHAKLGARMLEGDLQDYQIRAMKNRYRKLIKKPRVGAWISTFDHRIGRNRESGEHFFTFGSGRLDSRTEWTSGDENPSGMTYSKPVNIGRLEELNCEDFAAARSNNYKRTDCFWNPSNETERVIKPYAWIVPDD